MLGLWRRMWRKPLPRAGGMVVRPERQGPVVEGFIGRNLDELQATHDFFRFFHFEADGVETTYPNGDGEVRLLRPSGPAFRELVSLHSWVSTKGVIRTIRLTVRRSFIEDGRTCVHAADLYNSFLRSAGEVSAGDAIDAFAQEITARSVGRSSQPVITARALPAVKGRPSPAYEVYAGKRVAENLDYGSRRLRLVARNGDGEFEILVWPVEED